MAKATPKKSTTASLPLPDFEQALRGLQPIEAQLASAVAQQRLPSAYLCCGIEGIGKSLMGLRLAAALLAPAPPPQPSINLFGEAELPPPALLFDTHASALARMKHHSHSDFLYISPPYDEAKKRFKDEIPVNDIREIGQFLQLTAGEGRWKIVMIDPAEAMNSNAANSLLKWLEEPPAHSLFILISHQPDRLLPTIRSRCRTLHFPTPSREDFDAVMQARLPDAPHDLLYYLCHGSLGMALRFHETAWRTYWDALLALATHPTIDATAALALAEKIGKDSNFSLSQWQRLLEGFIAAIVRFQATEQAHPALPLTTLQQMVERHSLPTWLDIRSQHATLIDDAARIYLDKKQVILSTLTLLSSP